MKLKIIQTTDVHGAIFPTDLRDQKALSGTLARVFSYVKAQRDRRGQEVILLDNGDILQGSPEVYYANFVDTDTTHLLANVMNLMGYDAATIGNHDIEAGHPVYDRIRSEFDFPWMAANAIDLATEKPYFVPYHIVERQGMRIAVLGLTTPGIPGWLPEKLYKGIRFDDMVQSAQHWVQYIQEHEQPDLLVGLLHSGVDPYYGGGNPDKHCNENASLTVAQRVPGFDIIFAGHDHREYAQVVENIEGKKVLILDPRARAQNVAVAEITWTTDPRTKQRRKNIRGWVESVTGWVPDSLFQLAFAPYQEEVREYVLQPVAHFGSELKAIDAFFGPSAFIDLIHQAQLELSGAEISLAAPLSMNANLRQGPILVNDLFHLYKYENFLYTMSLSGAEVKNALEYSYAMWFAQMTGPADTLLLFQTDANGKPQKSELFAGYSLVHPFFNFDSAAGILYTVDLRLPAGQRVVVHSMADGSPFDPKRMYRVAVNSYRGNGGGRHLTLGAGIDPDELPRRILDATETDLRLNMIDWMRRKQHFDPKPLNHWKLIPEEWVRAARPQSQKMLGGY